MEGHIAYDKRIAPGKFMLHAQRRCKVDRAGQHNHALKTVVGQIGCRADAEPQFCRCLQTAICAGSPIVHTHALVVLLPSKGQGAPGRPGLWPHFQIVILSEPAVPGCFRRSLKPEPMASKRGHNLNQAVEIRRFDQKGTGSELVRLVDV